MDDELFMAVLRAEYQEFVHAVGELFGVEAAENVLGSSDASKEIQKDFE